MKTNAKLLAVIGCIVGGIGIFAAVHSIYTHHLIVVNAICLALITPGFVVSIMWLLRK